MIAIKRRIKLMKTYNFTQVYGILGKILCGIAGGIVGFVAGGLGFALFGAFAGLVVGHLIEKMVIHPSLKSE